VLWMGILTLRCLGRAFWKGDFLGIDVVTDCVSFADYGYKLYEKPRPSRQNKLRFKAI
jgi:hypothetical protein